SGGCAGALRPTAIFPSRISFWPPRWRGWARWTRRVPPCEQDLQSIQASLCGATVLAHQATIQLTLLGANAPMRACAWPEYPRANVREWVNRVVLTVGGRLPVHLQPRTCRCIALNGAKVESRMGAVAWGLRPSPRFPSPLIKPDVPISGIRLSGW